MSTQDNLKEAFAGESQANRKYLAFAAKAEKDGRPQVARLFRAAADAETAHAQAELRAMGGIGSTAENLQAAIEGEGFEFEQMYPKFLAEAKAEGKDDAAEAFEHAMKVEEIHHGLYGEALKTVQAGNDLPERKIFVCRYCGNTVYDDAPDKCPICGSPKKWFKEVM